MPILLAALVTSVTEATTAVVDSSIHLSIDVANPDHEIGPLLHGLFLEDINFSGDGGIYAELVRNRSFEDREPLFAWTRIGAERAGRVEVASEKPVHPNNPTYLQITAVEDGSPLGVVNAGFDGIPVEEGKRYRFSVRAQTIEGRSSSLLARLESAGGVTLGEVAIERISGPWREYEGWITSAGTTTKAKLFVLAESTGSVDLDFVSLFPEDTWKKRRNGLRADLVQILADMRPGFIRFPGGCIVEGVDFQDMYRWKDTIGGIAERKENWNLWQTPNGPAGHYSQTFGLGFFEYFQLCEDLGAAPIPIVNCGMCCQARGGPAVSMDELDPFVQDALDLIEFANGPVSSFWGSKRAAMGHPEPFNMKYLGAGNEQWGEACFERYAVFYEALKQRHPEIVLITTSGPHPDDKWWRFAWEKFHSGTPADMVDEHLHRPPHWFLANSDRYDDYTRPGPKVFAGGFAAHDGRRNNLRAALAEAAFMTGLWRNADIVKLAAYAPLFGRHGYAQWTPNLIWFDATRVYGTPSYHVQKMYSLHRPDLALPVKVDYAADQSVPPVFAAAGRDEKTREVVLALVNPHAAPAPVNVHLNGGGRWSEKATATILSGDPADENSLDRPNAVEPRTTFIEIPSPDFEYTIAPHAFVILRLGEERVLTTNTLKHE